MPLIMLNMPAASPRNIQVRLFTTRISHNCNIRSRQILLSSKEARAARHLSTIMQTRPFSPPRIPMDSTNRSFSHRPRCFHGSFRCNIHPPASKSHRYSGVKSGTCPTLREKAMTQIMGSGHSYRSFHQNHLLNRPTTHPRCSSQFMGMLGNIIRCKATTLDRRIRWPSHNITTSIVFPHTRRYATPSAMV